MSNERRAKRVKATPGPDKAKVEEFVQYLEECQLWEDAHEGYDAIREVWYSKIGIVIEQFQAHYPPHRQLPGEGQDLWRGLQAGKEAMTARSHTPFFRALDPFLVWLKTYYKITPPAKATGVEQPSNQRTSGKRKSSEQEKQLLLRATLFTHHFPEGGECVNEPLTGAALQAKLKWSQSMVSRTMNALFPRGGMRVYRAVCRRQGLEEYREQWSDEVRPMRSLNRLLDRE